MVLKIPKIIHQTCRTFDSIPKHWKDTPKTWMDNHKDWKYVFWDDESIEYYMRTYHPEFMDAWEGFREKIQRIDAFRYFILYDFGGIYCDMDAQALQNIEPYIDTGLSVYLTKSANVGSTYSNFFMVSEPGCGLWPIMWKRMRRPLKWYTLGKHARVMLTTGPAALTDAVSEYTGVIGHLPPKLFNATDVNEIKDGVVKYGTVLKNLQGTSWCGWDSVFYNFFMKYRWHFVILLAIVVVIILTVWIVKWLKRRKQT